MVHIANVFAQLLDNDEDGIVDNEEVHKKLRVSKASMIVFENENSELIDEFFDNFNFPETGTGAHAVGDVKTTLGQAMFSAVDAGHYDPDSNDPDLDVGTKITEYIYWAMSTLLGAQSYEGRLESITPEWTLDTAAALETADPAIHEILTDSQYAFPSVIPDGSYGQ